MRKRILIAPLDWGLGHATRCIPIIQHILDTGNEPIVASSGRPLEVLRSEFPNVEIVEFEGYNITYPEGSGMVWKMFKLIPHILGRISSEHKELQQLIVDRKLDAVISDNRFGFYTDEIPCVYITHQVMIKAPFFESLLHRLHKGYMDKFTHTWVPDYEKDGLSGDLAHRFPLPQNGRFIGSLTRFKQKQVELTRDILVLISGPEPQRTRFETLVLSQLDEFDGTAMAVLGTPEKQIDKLNLKGHRIVSHLAADEMEEAVAQSELIVSRSGYSTIMDLSVLGKKAVFVPTPGQTEQEYLAEEYHQKRMHLTMKQRDFNLQDAWNLRNEYSGFIQKTSTNYKVAVDDFLATLS